MKRLLAISSFITCALVLCGRAVWTIDLPPDTSVTGPLKTIDIMSVTQPLPGAGTTDTLIDLAFDRSVQVDTNGVTGVVIIRANLRVAVPRASTEALVGMPVGQIPHATLTNAVRQIAFSKLGSAIPAITQALASDPE